MANTHNRKQHPVRRLLQLAAVILLLWAIYKGASTRVIPSAMRADDSYLAKDEVRELILTWLEERLPEP